MTVESGSIYAEADGLFRAALAAGRMPHAWLLSGPPGIGKAAWALGAAAFLLDDGVARAATHVGQLNCRAGGQVANLMAAGSHPDFLWLKREVPKDKIPKDGKPPKAEDVARAINIEQVRQLQARCQKRPALSQWRAIVIDAADDLERGAANALLKLLEEPPPASVFLLISHQPGRLLPTIRSRCRRLDFTWDAARGDAMFAARQPDLGATERALLLDVAHGSPGRAEQYLTARLPEIMPLLHDIAQNGDRDGKFRANLAKLLGGAGGAAMIPALIDGAAAIAESAARRTTGAALVDALDARARILSVGRVAASQSESPVMVGYVVADAIAALAGGSERRD